MALAAWVASLPSNALAEPTWLKWAPPPECADKAHIEARVVEWLGGPIPEETDLDVSGEVFWNGEQWEVSVDVQLDGAGGRRKIAVQRCSDAVDFVVLAVVLAVDPSVVGEEEAAALLSNADPSKTEAPAENSPSPEEAVAAPKPETQSEEEPAGALMEEQAVSNRAAKRRFTGFVNAGAQLDVGALPSPAAGAFVGGGMELARIRFGLGARWMPNRGYAPSGAVPIEFDLLAARASSCWVGRVRSFELVPCLNLEAGRVRTEEANAREPTVTNQLWVATGVGASVGWRPISRFVPYVGADLQVPLTQPNFILSDGSSVHRPGVGVLGTAGLRLFFGQE